MFNERRSTALIQIRDQRAEAQAPEGVATLETVGRGADPAASPSFFLCLLTSGFSVRSPWLQAGGEGPHELHLHIQLRFPLMLTGRMLFSAPPRRSFPAGWFLWNASTRQLALTAALTASA